MTVRDLRLLPGAREHDLGQVLLALAALILLNAVGVALAWARPDAFLATLAATLLGMLALIGGVLWGARALRRLRFGSAPARLRSAEVATGVFLAIIGADAILFLVFGGVDASVRTGVAVVVALLGTAFPGFVLYRY